MNKNTKISLAGVAIVLIGLFVIISILLILLNNLHGDPRTCSMNMSNIYKALTIYALEHEGNFPRSIEFERTKKIDTNDPAFGANCLFMLYQAGNLEYKHLLCPRQKHNASGIRKQAGATPALRFDNNENGDRFCDYAYDPRHRQDEDNPVVVILADRPPAREAFQDGANPKSMNSPNHEGRGQNCLLISGSVEWFETPLCGVKNDNIYTENSELGQEDSWVVP